MISLNRLGTLILGINRSNFRVVGSDDSVVRKKEIKDITNVIQNQNTKFFEIFRELLVVLSQSLGASLVGVISFQPRPEPPPSKPGSGTLYYDQTLNRFLASENTSKFFDAFPREGCRVFNTGNISINNNTITALSFDSERFDPFSMFTLTSTQIVITRTGRYNVGGCIEFDDAAGGYRELCVRLNGTTNIVATNKLPNGAGVANDKMNVSCDYQFVAGDFLELTVYQNSGGALNVIATGNASPEFWCCRIHDQPV